MASLWGQEMSQRNSDPSNAARASSSFNRVLGTLMVSLALSGSIATPVMALRHAQPARQKHHDVAQHKNVLRVMAAVEKPTPSQRPACCSTFSDSINDPTLQIEQ
jgi:hypothetical protein